MKLRMMRNETCKTLCKVGFDEKKSKFINDRIREHYAFNWLIDGLPAARIKRDERTGQLFYSVGFELGELGGGDSFDTEEVPMLHNHYDIHIKYHTVDDMNFRVVGVLVWPFSRNQPVSSDRVDCDAGEPLVLDEEHGTNGVLFTYSVQWEPSQIPWGTRWDNYLHINDPKIHWFR